MRNVLDYLENSAKKHPQKVAFTHEGGSISFSELWNISKAIGTSISKITKKTKRPIGVITGRNFRCIAAFMGVLQSGNYYVPIDSEMPKTRLDSMLSDLSPELILYSKEDEKAAENIGEEFKKAEYSLEISEINEEDIKKRKESVLDIDPLYVIFTSGSTGVPKGIVISHRAVIDFTEWMAEAIGYDESDIFANQAPFYFDCSVKDLYLTLKLGATDHIIPKKLFMFPTLLVDFLNDHKVTALTWATSGFNLMSSSGILEKKQPKYLKKVAIGGEAMLAKHLNNWKRAMPDTKFVNLYGPTEVTVDCTYFEIKKEYKDHQAIPIGKACENKEVMLLDENLCPVKKGEPGEICVRGIGVSPGYYNNPEKTDQAFVRNPHLPYPDYIYKTGDIGIENEDGDIVFQARKDGQIKHMGYRIELGEIERGLNSLSGISAGICFYDLEKGRIVAVYEGEMHQKDIAGELLKLIPKYMIPNIYRKVDKMPYNANGKIDRVMLRREYDNEEDN